MVVKEHSPLISLKTYRDELVWQKAMLLVNKVYSCVQTFPENEKQVLSKQLKRSVISIPSKIADGYGQRENSEKKNTLTIALGSLYELQTQLEIALNQTYIRKEVFDILYQDSRDIERSLHTMIKKLN